MARQRGKTSKKGLIMSISGPFALLSGWRNARVLSLVAIVAVLAGLSAAVNGFHPAGLST